MSEKSELPPEGPEVTTSSDDVNRGGQPMNSATTRFPTINSDEPAQLTSLSSTTGHGNARTSQQELSQSGVTITVAQSTAFKSLWTAYLFWFPLGLVGLHNFYLGRRNFGVLYIFTGGVCFFGFLVDGLRMPTLVREANKRIEDASRATDGACQDGSRYISDDDEKDISLIDAYVLWFIYGFFGLHHFYLGRTMWGVLYMFTGGFFAVGVFVDLFLLPELVEEHNRRMALKRANREAPSELSLREAWLYGLTPAGLFGAHHFLLGRKFFGIFYLLTAGGCGIGWIVDWIRMPILVHRANNPERNPNGSRHKYLDDAYVLAFPLGILGLHHFYLERPKWGMLYFLTGGLCGFGWLRDLVVMDTLVREANSRLEQEATSVPTGQGVYLSNDGSFEGTATCTVTSSERSITFACQSVVLQLNGHVTVHHAGPQTLISTNQMAVAAANGCSPPPYSEAPVPPAPYVLQPSPPEPINSTDPLPRSSQEEGISNA